MSLIKFAALACAAACACSSFADAGNTLITFSTRGPDKYADGSTVKDDEWYALCWSPNAEFGGVTSECAPAVAGDRVFLAAPLAKDGRCPTVVFQLDSKTAPVDGNYFVYLLDTRGVDGNPSAVGAGNRPALVNGGVATAATAKGRNAGSDSAVVTDVELAKDGSGETAWGASEVAAAGSPVIKAFAIEGDKAVIKVSNLAGSVRYNIFTGAEVGSVSKTTLAMPISAESNEATFYIDKDEGKFFKVARQPLK